MASLWNRLVRLVRHRWMEGLVQRAFPETTLLRLERAVTESETRHTGQIRLCVEGGLPYSYIWRNASARERAISLFGKLRVWDTEHNNGVLIYLLMADHAIEIVADRALARSVPAQEWESIVQEMQKFFQRSAYAEGMEHALRRVAEDLAQTFPRHSSNADGAESNLPDAPVVQSRFFKDI